MDAQVSVIDVDSDIATFTVGGNDIGFGDTANACVFEVNCTPVCGETLTSTGNRIANDLPPRMDSLLIAIMNQTKSSGFKPYVTGYLHFWNVDTTQCDVVDFNFWADTPPSKLTRDLRTRINGWTQALNDQKNVLLAAHEAIPLHGGGNGAYALTPVSKLAKRTVAVEVLDEPVVTAAPKAMAFLV
ncbi:hypothetical protein N7G274_003855 [Stereocaulon virgatum]|uniref:Uncharacterized protein n=1 Tax=Stereocaulon virgatum TaxID=373712 RepID=A0ABR4AEQ8_9LECA